MCERETRNVNLSSQTKEDERRGTDLDKGDEKALVSKPAFPDAQMNVQEGAVGGNPAHKSADADDAGTPGPHVLLDVAVVLATVLGIAH